MKIAQIGDSHLRHEIPPRPILGEAEGVRAGDQTRRRYSPVRVSISILSPVDTKSGTWT